MNQDKRSLSRQNQDGKIEQNSLRNDDIHDPEKDQEKLEPDEAILDLPEVQDIPGQKHVQVLPLGELGDTTISSSDEEGDDILGR